MGNIIKANRFFGLEADQAIKVAYAAMHTNYNTIVIPTYTEQLNFKPDEPLFTSEYWKIETHKITQNSFELNGHVVAEYKVAECGDRWVGTPLTKAYILYDDCCMHDLSLESAAKQFGIFSNLTEYSTNTQTFYGEAIYGGTFKWEDGLTYNYKTLYITPDHDNDGKYWWEGYKFTFDDEDDWEVIERQLKSLIKNKGRYYDQNYDDYQFKFYNVY